MSDSIVTGDTLTPRETLISRDKRFSLYMSESGHITLYRFELGQRPINMWRFYCYHQRPYGEPWVAIRNGFLMGGDHRYQNRPYTPWWARLRNGMGNPVANPIFVMQSDGNAVLYARDGDGNIGAAGWSTGTNARHQAAINPDLDVAVLATGTLAIGANTIIENTLDRPINVNDGQLNAILNPGETIGARGPTGPGSLAIDVCHCDHNLEERSQNVTRVPNVTTSRSGNLVQIVPGGNRPFNWHEAEHHNFEHALLSLELEDREKTRTDKNA